MGYFLPIKKDGEDYKKWRMPNSKIKTNDGNIIFYQPSNHIYAFLLLFKLSVFPPIFS